MYIHVSRRCQSSYNKQKAYESGNLIGVNLCYCRVGWKESSFLSATCHNKYFVYDGSCLYVVQHRRNQRFLFFLSFINRTTRERKTCDHLVFVRPKYHSQTKIHAKNFVFIIFFRLYLCPQYSIFTVSQNTPSFCYHPFR